MSLRMCSACVVSVLSASAGNTDTTPTPTKNNTTNVVIQQKKSQAPDDGHINVWNMLNT